MKLPAALTPWAKHLQIFPEEISLTLGEYVRRISPLIAPMNVFAEDMDGEPNGYDGVARRGIYERLLLSEMALADDFSDEFVRRAVMGEHLFLNPAKVSPGQQRVSVALFDAGAMQIGTPRIAHLAAFVVLARRAEAAGAMFLWGVLQDAKQLVISDDTEASIKILLESRTARDVAAEDFSEWREKLRDVDRMADIWLVGSENLTRFDGAKDFSHLYVEESLELERRELTLKIKSASGAEKRTILELPPPNICTRLLRNPFETIAAPVLTTAKLDGTVTNFFFDTNGAKLFARLDSQDVLCFTVQNMPRTGAIYPTVYRSYDPKTYESKKIVAAGRLRKSIAFISRVDEQTIWLEYRKGGFGLQKGLYRTSNNKIVFPADENGLLPIFNARPKKFHYDEAAILDANRNLFVLTNLSKDRYESDAPVGAAFLTARNVLAVAQTDQALVFIGCEDNNEYHLFVSISDKIERHSLAGKKLKRALFGRGEGSKKIYAFEDASGNWTIADESHKTRIMPLPKGEVVGVCRDARLAPSAGFFELMDDRRTLEFCWAYGRRKLILTADDDIAKIEFSPRSPVLAYQTTGGELVIYSLTHRAAIGRYSK